MAEPMGISEATCSDGPPYFLPCASGSSVMAAVEVRGKKEEASAPS